jgi:hypothetical protein
MNFLPTDLAAKRRRVKQYKRMAVLEAAFSLIFAAVLFTLNFYIDAREAHTATLNDLIGEERYIESEKAAQSLRLSNQGEDKLIFPVFYAKRLEMLHETLPSLVTLIQADIDDDSALITAQTADLSLADAHRDAWVGTGLVSQVQLLSVDASEGNAIRYVISLTWKDEA